MRTVHKKLLKKLTVDDIREMRAMKLEGFNRQYLASKFNVNVTTVDWHTGDVLPNSHLEVICDHYAPYDQAKLRVPPVEL